MEKYRVVELIQPKDFKFKYPYVVYKYVKNKKGKPIYTAYKQFRKQERAFDFVRVMNSLSTP